MQVMIMQATDPSISENKSPSVVGDATHSKAQRIVVSLSSQMHPMSHQRTRDCAPANFTDETTEAFLVAAKWMMDTGCGNDLLKRMKADPCVDCVIQLEATLFNTANGTAPAKDVLPIHVDKLGGLKAWPYLMHSTPSVLSVGYRCMHQGCHFIWLTGFNPCLILLNTMPSSLFLWSPSF